jgi:DNA-binding NarL/FixJ family response regulator
VLHIPRYYFKGKREKPSEYCEYLLQNQTVDDTKEVDSEMYLEYVYSLLKDRQCDVVKLTLQGFKQQEIGKKLNISQRIYIN